MVVLEKLIIFNLELRRRQSSLQIDVALNSSVPIKADRQFTSFKRKRDTISTLNISIVSVYEVKLCTADLQGQLVEFYSPLPPPKTFQLCHLKKLSEQRSSTVTCLLMGLRIIQPNAVSIVEGFPLRNE